MELTVHKIDETTSSIEVSGRLNAVNAPELKAKIKTLVTGGCQNIVIDLTQTVFIDSSGLSVLVSGLKATREQGGFLRLVGLNDQTFAVFKLTMLDKVFEMFKTTEEAAKHPRS
jgi:anti-sigma B factor antagonist